MMPRDLVPVWQSDGLWRTWCLSLSSCIFIICVYVRVCMCMSLRVCCVVSCWNSAKGYLNFGMPRHLSTVVCIQRPAFTAVERCCHQWWGKGGVQGEVRSSPSHIHLSLAQPQSCWALASQLGGGSHAKSTCPTVCAKIFIIPYPGISELWCTAVSHLGGFCFFTNKLNQIIGEGLCFAGSTWLKNYTPKGSNKADQPFTLLLLLVPRPWNPLKKYKYKNNNSSNYLWDYTS